MAAALILGLLLASITGYVVWHSGHSRYVKAGLVGASGPEAQQEPGGGGGQEPGGGPGQEPAGPGTDQNGDEMDGQTGQQAGREIDQQPGREMDQQAGSGADEENEGRQEAGKGADKGADGNGAETSLDQEEGPVRLVFAGDLLLSDHVLGAYGKTDTIESVVDSGFRQVIESSDVFMANEEFPFSSRGTAAEDKQFTFRLPPERVSIFEELGVDIVTLANNHALDYGTDALLDSCAALDEAGILHVGAGADLDEAKKPAFMDVRGRKVGFLGASRVIPVGSWNATASGPGMLTTYDPALLLEEIGRAREMCDYLVVYVHWGIERDERPQEYQRKLGQQYIDAGADLVIGSHPHVLQGLEYYKGKPIVYSLGNFIFGSSIPRTALLTVDWDGQDPVLRLVPGTSSGGFTRAYTDEGDKNSFYQYITSISYGVNVGEGGLVTPD